MATDRRTGEQDGTERPRPRPPAFLFPGQGSQHSRMAAGLYEWEPVFTAAMDLVFEAVGPDGERLRDDWLAQTPRTPVDHVTRAQPLLFAVDQALAAMVRGWGAEPAALLGHSAGELAAATTAGVFAPADAARVMADRAARLATMPPGGMLAVAGTPEELAPYLRDDVVVGVLNAPRQTMLAGSRTPLAATERELRSAGFTCREVRATTAFHSPAVRGAVDTAVLDGLRLAPPALPLWSAYEVGRLAPGRAADPWFWANHPVDPVWFGPALDALLCSDRFLLVETGPGQGLSGLARRHPRVRSGESAAVALLPARPRGPAEDRRAVARAALRIRQEGHPLPGLPAQVAAATQDPEVAAAIEEPDSGGRP
ncbi:acyltransferase domain-containing protein [Streptomyces sp. NPDC057555]|uniref:acyltransferase domain-containing protein n=1 Tax=Streptomyces sp. NPDC057555 TaxID=3346166 RepID=UPI0036766906